MNARPYFLFLPALTLAAALTATPAIAQVPPGYRDSITALPGSTMLALRLPAAAAEVHFDGQVLNWVQGGVTTVLFSLQSPVFPSFLTPVGSGHLLFGENSNGDLWLVPMTPGGALLVANVPFNYDAVLVAPGIALISALTGGWTATHNDLLLIDLATGQTTAVGKILGASGALALDPGGHLVYATAPAVFPAPLGSVDVLTWTPQQVQAAIAGTGVLDRTTARVAVSALNAVGAMVFDGDGDLLTTDWLLNQVVEIDDALGPKPVIKTLFDHTATGLSPTRVQFLQATLPTPGFPQFEPYQPAVGGELLILETDFAVTAQFRSIEPRRALLSVSPGAVVSPGPFTIQVGGAAPGGFAFLALAPAPLATGEVPIPIPGIEQLLPWNSSMLQPIVTRITLLDGTGSATFSLLHPGLPTPLAVGAQVAFVDGLPTLVGSTAPVEFTLN